MIRLYVTPPRGAPFERVFEGTSLVVGRAPSADLVLTDRFLSRLHARLSLSDDGVLVEDLGSYNGTFVDGVRVAGVVAARPGARIRVSSSEIRVLPALDETTVTSAPARPPPPADQGSDEIPGATVVLDASDLLSEERAATTPERSDTVEYLVRYGQRLALLNEVHRALTRTAGLGELLELILDRIFDHFRPEDAAIYLRSDGGELSREAARATDEGAPQLDSEHLEREVAEKGRAVMVLDTRQDERFAGSESLIASGVRSLLAAPLLDEPLQGGAAPLGMIVLGSRVGARRFDESDLEILVSLASVAAMRIRNTALAEEAQERRRLEEELVLARSIQVALLTEALPVPDGWELWAGNVPSRRVSGDFYKVVEREIAGRRELVLLLADVSGKGMAASLLTVAVEAMAAGLLAEVDDPGAICRRINRLLHGRTPASKYVTGILVLVDPLTGRLRYTSAGHNPALVVRASGTVDELPSTGQPLGLLPEIRITPTEGALAPGDLLVLYSDGITEATDRDQREYGLDRLRRACVDRRSAPLAHLAEAIEEDLERFAAGHPFVDDRTLVLARRRG